MGRKIAAILETIGKIVFFGFAALFALVAIGAALAVDAPTSWLEFTDLLILVYVGLVGFLTTSPLEWLDTAVFFLVLGGAFGLGFLILWAAIGFALLAIVGAAAGGLIRLMGALRRPA